MSAAVIDARIATIRLFADSWLKNRSKGIDIAAQIELSDTYRVAFKTIPKIAIAMLVWNGATTQKTPHPVATPLPPLKFKKGE